MFTREHALRARLERTSVMIKLNRLDGEPFILNAELIRYVESRPDTFVSLTTGERLVVKQSMEQVLELALEYQRSKYLLPTLPTAATNANSFAVTTG
jgi:flagellar protein FlbD